MTGYWNWGGDTGSDWGPLGGVLEGGAYSPPASGPRPRLGAASGWDQNEAAPSYASPLPAPGAHFLSPAPAPVPGSLG